MLNALRGSRTLILLVIANLPDTFAAMSNIIVGVWGQSAADEVVKILTGIIAMFTVMVRLIPEDKKDAQ